MSREIICIGNALVDVVSPVSDKFLSDSGLIKGSMRLVDRNESEMIQKDLKITTIYSGGSIANTAAGIGHLGGEVKYIGKVGSDAFGDHFIRDLAHSGVSFPNLKSTTAAPTGHSLILVTPDGERTMNTHLGACHDLSTHDIKTSDIQNAGILFVEGYLFDHPGTALSAEHAITSASCNAITALTLSDTYCVERHRERIIGHIENKSINMVLANKSEMEALYGCKLEQALDIAQPKDCIFIITQGSKGVAVVNGAVELVPAVQVDKIVDLIGAGDAFAAGFLKSLIEGADLTESASAGARFASQIIQIQGARLK